MRARFASAQVHFAKAEKYREAGQLDAAIAEYQQVVYLAPAHQFAANELAKALTEWRLKEESQVSRMEAMKRRIKNSPGRNAPRLKPGSNIPIVLRFKNETIEKIYDALSKASGINFIYDDRLDLSKKISIDIADVTFAQSLGHLMAMNKHFFKIWDENTILIADDTPQKHKEHDDLVIQTFYLSNADVKDVQVLLRTLLDARQIAQNDRLNAITIRDTPARVQVAQKIIEANDKAKAELVIDIELLEVNRTMLQNLGIDLFGPEGGTGKTLGLQYAGGNAVSLENLDLLKQKGSWLLGPVPGVVINFLKADGDAQVIARPQLRVSAGEKASVRIGDRIPIPTTTFNAAPTIGGTVGIPITSFTYQNVGINIDLEPRVHHNREITLKAKIEISSLAGTVSAGGGVTQPIIGTREIDTTIRLRDGETNLLAGLIREEERKSLTGVPGLSSIPILRRLFGNTETNVQKVDIVLTITPHIIRIPDITEEDLLPLWIGTEQNIALRGASRQSAFGNMFEETPVPPSYPGIPDFSEEEADSAGSAAAAGTFGAVTAVAGSGGTGASGGPDISSGGGGDEVEVPPLPAAAAVPPPDEIPAEDQPPPDPGGPAVVTFDPSYLATAVGEEFSASVVISGASQVGSVPFHLGFDPQYVEFLGAAQDSPFLGQDGTPVFVLATVGGNGREVIVGLSRQGSRPGIGGQGILIELKFRAKKSGTTALGFTDLSVLDPSAQPLPFEKLGMTVVVQ
ncbi:MAG: cohesin domain-containing protein, partial [Acidobacteria bacterium]|nr:cohesin domain-containing protein [Acidobacteriota bacterium]